MIRLMSLPGGSAQHFVEAHFDAYLDGALSATEVSRYESHLDACASCRDWVAANARLGQRLQAEAPPRAILSRQAIARIQKKTLRRARRSLIMTNLWDQAGSVAVLALLVAAVGFFVWQQSTTPEAAVGSVDVERSEPRADDAGATAIEEALVAAVRDRDLNEVERLLAAGADPNTVEVPDPFFSNPVLRTAVMNGDVAMVRLLIASGADVNAPDSKGDQMLWRAVRSGELEIVQMLLDAGASVHAINSQGDAVLPLAVDEGDAEMVRELLDRGADPNGRMTAVICESPAMAPALTVAAMAGRYDLAATLLDAGADVGAVDAPPQGVSFYPGTQALHEAANFNHADIVELLLDNGADINALTTQAHSALLFAAEQGAEEAARVLIEWGADVTIPWIGGDTPLDVSTSEAITNMLLEAGAGPGPGE